MTIDKLNRYLLAKPETQCVFPFGENVFVYKVKGKMFALVSWRIPAGKEEKQLMMNLKCDPDESLALQDIFEDISAAYHMNKKHWISVYFDLKEPSKIPFGEVQRLMDNAYLLVVNKLTKAQQVSIRLHL